MNTPQQYGVVEFDDMRPRALDRGKAAAPKSNVAVTGLYFYDNDVVKIAACLKPSPRGELEITDVNRAYMDRGDLYVEVLGRGFAWLDTGTHASLVEASHFVQILEQRQGMRIACPEEIALRLGYITLDHFEKLAQRCAKSSYGEYLLSIHRSLCKIAPSGALTVRFKNSVVFVTGGAGFIGSAVVRHLLDDTDACVVNIDKLTYAACLDSIPQANGHDRYRLHRSISAMGPHFGNFSISIARNSDESRGREPRRPLNRRTRRIHPDQYRRHLHAIAGGVALLARSRPASASAVSFSSHFDR